MPTSTPAQQYWVYKHLLLQSFQACYGWVARSSESRIGSNGRRTLVRDPDGSVELTAQLIHRRLATGAGARIRFLRSEHSRSLVREGLLVDFSFVSECEICSPRIPFVSYPSEWCDAQLRDAGRFTLDLSERILEDGMELKDASAFNVLFAGGAPIFCDHLSFVPIQTKQWWAMGQYARHFALPLNLAKRVGWHAHKFHMPSVDGIAPHEAADLLGVRRYFTTAWPLMMGAETLDAPRYVPLKNGEQSYHPLLYKYCRWCLPGKGSASDSRWVRYTTSRQHYSLKAEQKKNEVVWRWLQGAQPKWVIDIGCNTGEYSLMAEEVGAMVVSLDADHDSINQLYQSKKLSRTSRIHPVIVNLADMSSGSGWLGQEKPSIITRLSVCGELVLCLGLLHHLIAAEGILLEAVADFLRNLTHRYLILEVIAPDDPMVHLLMAQRNRTDLFPPVDKQLEALMTGFRVRAREMLGRTRELVFLERLGHQNGPR